MSGLDQNAVIEIVELMDRYSAGVVKLYSEPKPGRRMAGMPNLGMFLQVKKLVGLILSQQFGKNHSCQTYCSVTRVCGSLR